MRADDHVNVVTANVECVQFPTPMTADASHCCVHHRPVFGSKRHRRVLKLTAPTLMETRIPWQQRFTPLIVLRVCTSPRVAMKPGAIASEGDKIGEWVTIRVNDRLVAVQYRPSFHARVSTHGPDNNGAL